MTEFVTPPKPLIKPKSGRTRLGKQPFWIIAALANGTIWLLALALLQLVKPSYTSKGSIIIPGVANQSNVVVPGLGVASASNKEGQSPYSYLLKIDPRQNYQYIGMSDAVLSQAAKTLDMSVEEFGEPIIILSEGTTIIEFSIEGKTAEEAQQKGQAFYQALVNHTDYLRATQANQQKENSQKTLQSSRTNVREAQSKLSQFRNNSALKVTRQISTVSDQLEELRLNKANLITQEQAASSRFRQLETSLNLSADLASDSLLIIDDRVLQESLNTYSSKLKELQLLSSSMTAQNPQVIEAKEEVETLKRSIVTRASQLLNRPVNLLTIERLSLGAKEGRQELVETLLTLQAEQKAVENQIAETDKQIVSLESRLNTLIAEQPVLNRLAQDVQLSESILVSEAAKLNLNQPESATSYPVIQLLSEPSLPEEPDRNLNKTIILGALASSFLLTTGIVMFWWEKPNSHAVD